MSGNIPSHLTIGYQKCASCKETLPMERFYRAVGKSGRVTRRTTCHDCSAKAKLRYASNKTGLLCVVCGERKPPREFANGTDPYAHNKVCLACSRTTDKGEKCWCAGCHVRRNRGEFWDKAANTWRKTCNRCRDQDARRRAMKAEGTPVKPAPQTRQDWGVVKYDGEAYEINMVKGPEMGNLGSLPWDVNCWGDPQMLGLDAGRVWA